MKQFIIALLILAGVSALHAESIVDGDFSFPFTDSSQSDTQTLFGNEFSVSGFGGPVMTFGKVKDSYAIMTGGRGGAIFNNTFIIGAGGYGLVHPMSRETLSGQKVVKTQDGEEELKYVGMGYGGPMVGVNLFQKSVINLSLTSVIGAGGIYLSSSPMDEEDNSQNSDDQKDRNYEYDVFFVCEPTLMAHVNVTRWCRMGAGISYRYTNGIHKEEFSDDDFRNFSYVISAEFGWF